MGKKSKYKDGAAGEKQPQQAQQQKPNQQEGQAQQKGPAQQASGGGRGQKSEQGPRDGGRGQQSQQGAWGSQPQQPPQGGGDGGRRQQSQQGARDGGRGQQSQQAARDGGRGQQQSQQGAWGSQPQQPPQQGGGDGGRGQQSQQGAWGSQPQQPPQQGGGDGGRRQQSQQGARDGGRGQQSQQAARDGGRGQQQSQQGAWGSQPQHPPQQGGGDGGRGQQSQQGAWGSQPQQPPQQGGGDRRQQSQQGARDGGRGQQSQQGARDGGRGQQQSQQGAWGSQQQQPPQQGGRGGGQQQQRSQPQYQQRGGGGRQMEKQQSRESLSQNMAQLSISSETPLPNKAISCNNIVRGTLGKPDIVEVNYLKLDLSKMPKEAYHYDVAINPDRPKKFLRPVFEQCAREVFPKINAAFDGMKSCYTLKRLPTPIDRKIEIADSGGRTKEFQIQIKETDTCVVDLNVLRTYQNERVFDKPMRALQVLEVVMASNNHRLGVRVGRSFFRKPDKPYDLEDGYEAWTGLYQAAILGEEPLVNVDIAHKSFPCETTLIRYLENKRVDLTRSFGGRDISDIKNFLKGINIVYTPPESFGSFPKTYKVLDIGDPADATKFRTDDGKEQTVANYFRSRGYTLRYPKLNCVKVGSSVKQIALPIELCSIPGGQSLNRKDKDKQVSNMVRYAATSTNVRKEKIMNLLNYFKHNDNDMIREFGLKIGSNFIKVPMRLLPQPFMEYLQGRTVTTFKGAWRMENNMQFLITSKPQGDHKWAILYEEGKCRKSYHELKEFMNAVINTSRGLNMKLQETAEIIGYTLRDMHTKFRDLAAKKYDLVFVVLAEYGIPYSKIKQTAELEVGILTQCIKEKTIFRTVRDRTIFSNILLKVNGKLNGTNHKIATDRDMALKQLMTPIENVMYLGADVTHPSPDQRHIPSVVGVAASHDMYGACYNCQYRLQTSKNENIEDMESIMLKHLEIYKKYQKKYPSKIIYYRDGVSDGQFPQVKNDEVRCIKSACRKMGCDPKLTCIIVVKRHHTRFFPLTRPRDDRDFNNVQAGSVVDQHITHPNEVQFFMVSHQSIQGTAKPTRYNVIVDESNLDINLLQKLTYNLCHLFPRCNRAVSYPAPAYLAHLVAFRGRVYIEGTFKFDKNLRKEYEKRLIRPEFMNKNPMYFI